MSDSALKTEKAPLTKRPLTGPEWRPYFEQALIDYTSEQEGAMSEISVRNLVNYMQTHDGYPVLENEDSVRKLMNAYLREFFGPTWDGVKYRKHRSVGRSLLIGTDNVLSMIRHNREIL